MVDTVLAYVDGPAAPCAADYVVCSAVRVLKCLLCVQHTGPAVQHTGPAVAPSL
jgi:hypothetical protein